VIGVSAGRSGLHVKRGNMSEDSGVLLRLQFGSVIRVEEECHENSYFDARRGRSYCLHRPLPETSTDKASCDKAGGTWDDTAKKCSEKKM